MTVSQSGPSSWATPLAASPAATAAAIGFLDAQLLQPLHPRHPSAKAAATASTGYSSIIEARARPAPRRREAPNGALEVGDVLTAGQARD